MIDLFIISLSLLMGMGLGLLYFGGLWLTVRKLPYTNNPALLTLVSFIVRLSLCLLGFYWVMVQVKDYNILPLLVSLAAFFWIRNLLIHRLKPNI